MEISKEWCVNMASLEGEAEIGVGILAADPIGACPECAVRYEAQVKLADLLAAEKTENEGRARKWFLKAQDHETAARELDPDQGEEFALHIEIARVLRECAQELVGTAPSSQDGATP
jgi:hypothetical protein